MPLVIAVSIAVTSAALATCLPSACAAAVTAGWPPSRPITRPSTAFAPIFCVTLDGLCVCRDLAMAAVTAFATSFAAATAAPFPASMPDASPAEIAAPSAAALPFAAAYALRSGDVALTGLCSGVSMALISAADSEAAFPFAEVRPDRSGAAALTGFFRALSTACWMPVASASAFPFAAVRAEMSGGAILAGLPIASARGAARSALAGAGFGAAGLPPPPNRAPNGAVTIWLAWDRPRLIIFPVSSPNEDIILPSKPPKIDGISDESLVPGFFWSAALYFPAVVPAGAIWSPTPLATRPAARPICRGPSAERIVDRTPAAPPPSATAAPSAPAAPSAFLAVPPRPPAAPPSFSAPAASARSAAEPLRSAAEPFSPAAAPARPEPWPMFASLSRPGIFSVSATLPTEDSAVAPAEATFGMIAAAPRTPPPMARSFVSAGLEARNDPAFASTDITPVAAGSSAAPTDVAAASALYLNAPSWKLNVFWMSAQPLTFAPACCAAADTAAAFAWNVAMWVPPSISAVCSPTVPPIALDSAAENVCADPPPAFRVALNPWAASAVVANCFSMFACSGGSAWSSVRHALL